MKNKLIAMFVESGNASNAGLKVRILKIKIFVQLSIHCILIYINFFHYIFRIIKVKNLFRL